MGYRIAPACILSCVLLLLPSAPAVGQAWPVKPVRVIAPFAPGGTADTLGRLVSLRLAESAGQAFIVENRAGAGGVVGSEIAARSAPDGYTLVVSGVASHVIAPALTKVAFDPLRDFTHIALIGGPPAVLAVHPALPSHDLKAFVALAKARPGQLTYGSPGNGTQGHLIAEMLKRAAAIDVRHVPYRGASLAMPDAVAGHIHGICTTLTSASAQIRSGRLRALALSSEQRLEDFRDVPTFRELGFRELVATVWFGLSGPAGIPSDIASKLNTEIARILQLRDVRERLRQESIEAASGAGAKSYSAFVAAEIERWTPVVRASGAKAD